jgi:uncharacterized membrane protein (DUF373 family)
LLTFSLEKKGVVIMDLIIQILSWVGIISLIIFVLIAVVAETNKNNKK